MLRIERQNLLQTLDAVSDEQGKEAESENGQSVLLRILLLAGIHAAKLVDQSLDGSKHTGQRLPVAFENAKHVRAQRFGERANNRHKEQYLDPTIDCHDISAFEI